MSRIRFLTITCLMFLFRYGDNWWIWLIYIFFTSIWTSSLVDAKSAQNTFGWFLMIYHSLNLRLVRKLAVKWWNVIFSGPILIYLFGILHNIHEVSSCPTATDYLYWFLYIYETQIMQIMLLHLQTSMRVDRSGN